MLWPLAHLGIMKSTWHQYKLLTPSQLWRLHTLSKHEPCPRHTLQLSWSLWKHKLSSDCCYGDWVEQRGPPVQSNLSFIKNYMCVWRGGTLDSVIDMQFIILHWMLLKDERLKWILSPDNVSLIFSCGVGWVYYMISDVILKVSLE